MTNKLKKIIATSLAFVMLLLMPFTGAGSFDFVSFEADAADVDYSAYVATYVNGDVVYGISSNGSYGYALNTAENAVGETITAGTSDGLAWYGLSSAALEYYYDSTNDYYSLVAGNYYLTEDLVLDSESDSTSYFIYIYYKDVKLNLNGHSIDGNGIAEFTIYFESKSANTFELFDSVNGDGEITGATSAGIKATGYYYTTTNQSRCNFNMYGGSITDNSGRGMYFMRVTFNMYGGSITNNSVSGNGGAMYAYYSEVTISNSLISGNSATGNGGGFYLSGNSASETTLTINDSVLSNNSATTYGGAIYSTSIYCYVYLDGCEIFGNSAKNGGVVYKSYYDLEISDCLIYNNYASECGGAIYILYNSTSYTGDYALDFYLTDTTIVYNYAGTAGGAMYYCNDKYTYCYVSGKTIVTENFVTTTDDETGETTETENNIYLEKGSYSILNLTNGLEEGSMIGITCEEGAASANDVLSNATAQEYYYVYSDVTGSEVVSDNLTEISVLADEEYQLSNDKSAVLYYEETYDSIQVYNPDAEPTTYDVTVKYIVDGEEKTETTTTNIGETATITIAEYSEYTTEQENYTYEWNTATDGTGTTYAVGAEVSFTEAAELTLYLIETAPTEITLTYDVDGETTATATATVKAGTDATFTVGADPTKDNYTFTGWTSDIEDDETEAYFADDTITTSEDVTLTATWILDVNGNNEDDSTEEKLTVTFTNGDETVETFEVIEKTQITAPAAPTAADEYTTFTGWVSGETTLEAGAPYTVTADATFTATWLTDVNGNDVDDSTEETYTVTFDENGGSTVTDVTGVLTGTVITLPTDITQEGYTFDGWKVEGTEDSTATTGSYTVTESVTLVAVWTQNTTTEPDDGDGETSTYPTPDDDTACDCDVCVDEVDNTDGSTGADDYCDICGGYIDTTTDGSDDDSDESGNTGSSTVTYYENGGTDVNDVTVTTGTQIVLPTIAKEGYTFDGWSDGTTTYTGTYTVTADANLYAMWTETTSGESGDGSDETGDTGDGSSDTSDGDCDCICHSTNWFVQIWYGLVKGIWKLFNVNRVCGCGTYHYYF